MSETNGIREDPLVQFERVFRPDDGYTVGSQLERIPGYMPRLRFRYRPSIPRESAAYRNAPTDERSARGSELIASHVFGVCYQKPDGTWSDPVPTLTPSAVERMPDQVWYQLLHHVIGVVGPVALGDAEGNASSPGSGSST